MARTPCMCLIGGGLPFGPLIMFGKTRTKHVAEPRDRPCRPRAPQRLGFRVGVGLGLGRCARQKIPGNEIGVQSWYKTYFKDASREFDEFHRSMLIFASCVVGTCNILCGWLCIGRGPILLYTKMVSKCWYFYFILSYRQCIVYRGSRKQSRIIYLSRLVQIMTWTIYSTHPVSICRYDSLCRMICIVRVQIQSQLVVEIVIWIIYKVSYLPLRYARMLDLYLSSTYPAQEICARSYRSHRSCPASWARPYRSNRYFLQDLDNQVEIGNLSETSS